MSISDTEAMMPEQRSTPTTRWRNRRRRFQWLKVLGMQDSRERITSWRLQGLCSVALLALGVVLLMPSTDLLSQKHSASGAGRYIRSTSNDSDSGGSHGPEWEQCDFEKAHTSGAWVFSHTVCIMIIFIAVAIVCDDFFVPSLEVISEKLKLSEDVAGATFMAAGSSAPELFTSVAGVVVQTDVGVGTIVGSAVFNLLVIIALTGALAGQVLHLDWRPMLRDAFFYAMSIGCFIGFAWDGYFQHYEAAILLCLYCVYITLMVFNPNLMQWLASWRCCCTKPVVSPQEHESEKEGSPDPIGMTNPELVHSNPKLHDAEAARRMSLTGGHARRISLMSQRSHSEIEAGALPNARYFHHKRGSIANVLIASPAGIKGQHRDSGFQSMHDASGLLPTPDTHHTDIESPTPEEDSSNPTDPSNGEAIEMSVRRDGYSNGSFSADSESPTNNNSQDEPPKTASANGIIHVKSENHPVMPRKSTATEDVIRETEEDSDAANGAVNGDVKKEAFAEGNGKVDGALEAKEDGEDKHEEEEEEEEEEERTMQLCPCLPCCPAVRTWPPDSTTARENGGCWNWTKLFLRWVLFIPAFPFVCLFSWTIPDCSKESNKKYFILSFAMAVLWIAILSFGMVTLVGRTGCILGVDTYIMGLVIIAIGTSIPDALSSILVARDGFGDMAVSNAIGSNVFDINLGLGLPFIIRIAIDKGVPIQLLDAAEWAHLHDGSMPIVPHVKFGFLLLLILFIALGIFFLAKFRLTKWIGITFMVIYIMFLSYAFVQELYCVRQLESYC